MTRKHFKEFAELLAKHTVTNQLIIDLCQIFKKDNPRFDASTFIYYYQDKKTKFQNKQNENGNKSKFGKEAMKEFVENMQQ
jgi:hypothetical protein